MVSSPPRPPLPGLHLVPVFRGKITEPPVCPHNACSSPSPLSTTSPTLPTARSKRRQTRSQLLDNPERPSGGIPGTNAPRVLPRQGTVWPQSMRSGSTYLALFVFSKYLHFRPLLPDIRPSRLHPLLPTVNKGIFLYSNLLTTLTVFACTMNTTSILRSISSGLAHSHVPGQFGVRRRYRGGHSGRQTVTLTNNFARFGLRVGPGWAQHVTFGNG